MNPRRADSVVSVIVALVLLTGGVLSWRAYQQRRAIDQTMGPMMGSSTGMMYGPDPLWYAFSAVIVAVIIGGGYLVVRDDRTDYGTHTAADRPDADPATTAQPATTAPAETQPSSLNPESNPLARVLDLLPDDERRVLEPVLNSPGLTQIELRDRSEFSKSKVSQTVSALEERGLLYRERQGRTYRIYPSDDLRQNPE